MTHETAQTREALVEVIRNALWRQSFAPHEYATIIERQKTEWRDDWARTLPKAEGIIAALEAAGVRLVPSEASAEMIAMAEMLYTVDELTSEEYRAAYRVMTAYSPYAKDKP
jgi:hypothetical protein